MGTERSQENLLFGPTGTDSELLAAMLAASPPSQISVQRQHRQVIGVRRLFLIPVVNSAT